ncbi:unnamed protein product [Effrenium voratum]|uniref:Major facilitator superfamily (MFS) profile domain-containing protein n=1 Tax=Effrenium voratum TaxID=2562239 RepID=A0AA36IJN5_9DINO|nr:unnamed protein product [Effrenium voratum]
MKLAADPALPGLTAETLPFSATAIFAGWLVGSVSLKQALEMLSKAQFLAISSVLLCLSTLATVTLPHLTGGRNIFVFSAVRFVTGLLFATGPVGNLYHVQDCLPPCRRNQAMAFINTAYSIMAVLMATSCGMFQFLDWRLDALLWCGLPPFLAFFIAFKKPTELLQSIPDTIQSRTNCNSSRPGETDKMSPSVLQAALKLAVCFLACGVGSYGLSYSAGKLSESLYTNSVLLNSADILGYIAVLGADSVGRKTFQAGSYLLAGVSLLLCAILQPGSWTIIACAMAGRICLNVAFTTIYVALAEIFPETSQKSVLPMCQIAARLGGVLAPLSGTLPAALSCPAFGAACVVAAMATLSLPEKLEDT